MHPIDVLIVAIIAASTYTAFRVGLIQQVVSLASLVIGVILAGQLYSELSGNLDFTSGGEQSRNLISFIAIFAGIAVLGQLASVLLRGIAGVLLLGPLNSIGGAAFGFLQGLLFVEVLLIGATTFHVADEIDAAIENSAIAPLFLERVPVAERVLPAEFKRALDAFQSGGIGTVPAP